jgi:hypothetical protein
MKLYQHTDKFVDYEFLNLYHAVRVGTQGEQGEQGVDGAKGNIGPKGDTGPQGEMSTSDVITLKADIIEVVDQEIYPIGVLPAYHIIIDIFGIMYVEWSIGSPETDHRFTLGYSPGDNAFYNTVVSAGGSDIRVWPNEDTYGDGIQAPLPWLGNLVNSQETVRFRTLHGKTGFAGGRFLLSVNYIDLSGYF